MFLQWSRHIVDLTFSLNAFPLDDTTRFSFILWKLWFLEKDLESSLIFFLFLKGKQNKKKNSKCDSLFGKDDLWKIESGFEG